MARTIPFPFIDHMPSTPDAMPGLDGYIAKIQALIDDYTLGLGDVDKAGDPEDACFHEGRLEALEQSLALLLDVPHDVWDTHHGR